MASHFLAPSHYLHECQLNQLDPLEKNFREIFDQNSKFKGMHLKMSSAKYWPFCLGLDDLTHWGRDYISIFFGFHWSLFPRVQLAIFQHRFRQWLGTDQVTSHYLKPMMVSLLSHIYIYIYTLLGLNKLMRLFGLYQHGGLTIFVS